MLSQLLCLGRHTVTGVLSTAGRQFWDWTADYRMYSSDRVDTHALLTGVRRTLTGALAAGKPLVTALDDTRLRKSGRKTHGVKYTRDRMGPPFHINLIKAQRFLQISMASTTDTCMARMIPIDFVHAPAPRKPSATAGPEAHTHFSIARRDMAMPNVAAQRLRLLRAAMDQDGESNRSLWAVVDGGFTNRTLIRQLPERTVLIGRIRSDAKLYHLPECSQARPGRTRVYGRRAPTPEALRQDRTVPWARIQAFAAGKMRRFKIKTLAPLRWRPAGKEYTVRLIVIAPLKYRRTKHSQPLYRKPAYLICTDPNVSIQQILQAYIWRWDIEVNFRDEKTLLGVGQAQVRHNRSVENVPALAVAAYAMLLTSATQAFGPTAKPADTPRGRGAHQLPPPKWRRTERLRASTQSLISRLRHEVWADSIHFSAFVSLHTHHPNTQKLSQSLPSALFYANG